MKKLNYKKLAFTVLTFFLVLTISTVSIFGARKLITKKVSDSFSIWSAYHYNYSFNASAVLTYDNSNKISQISDLSLSSVTYTTGTPSLTANFIVNQKSKSVMSDKLSARYVVTLTRNIYGYYSDKVDYTLTYRVSDSGTPYSMNGKTEPLILVDVEISEPYDVQILQNERTLYDK